MKNKFIYLKYLTVPNIMTECSLAIGFISLLLIHNRKVEIALTLYASTILLDRLDGFAARKFHLESDFGKEMDSFADFFNFCILPPIILYFMGLDSVWAVPVLIVYILAGVSRLAHFNLAGMDEIGGKKFFSGIPTTLAASWFLIAVILFMIWDLLQTIWIPAILLFVLAVLMVAPLRCDKNGILVKSQYLLLPAALVLLWVFTK